mmetsp:Transcript_12673/g.23755  ORF Transcript_12673/g.23755 Transcript_12673/m.23755 type:complete len:379 (-) Transcript_12673:129-1265(-)|eukprot:CAMPEP_0176492688 /NCGR_PEP_ID=MMETSP0200_2-20121128/9141_1 /TAXON_ID=947934 /ORGANISM="Chaetoceros sp., Strain GSL56" /LENGTH=378 /DNA_ID=CAMNT_0017890285 /DNA_START=283 /DNA_END=1419 /DNA_ORIENTATION=+
MSSPIFQKKKVLNNSTFPSYSDDIGSSSADSSMFSEGYTFSAEEETTCSEDARASLAKSSQGHRKFFRNKVIDDESAASAQSKSTMMAVLTTLDRALDAVVDIIIPVEKGIIRSDTLEEDEIPMSKKPSLIQKIISPRSTNCPKPESPKDPTPTFRGFSSPKSETDTEVGRSSRYDRTLEQRDDVSPQSPDAQARRDDGSFASDMLREGNEKISNLFDVAWMYETTKDDETEKVTPVADAGDESNKTRSFTRRKGLSKAESKKTRFWRRNSAQNQTQAKSSKRWFTSRKEDSQNPTQSKTARRSLFKRKNNYTSKTSGVVEEEEEVDYEHGKDCADWLMNGMCCGNNNAEEETKQSNAKKKKRKWRFGLNRRRREKLD